jgi:catechol 2,3-dioxygenase-like lactoylglutathione lyase family enzyme
MSASTPAFGLSQIGQISINVHEIERAVAFYRDALGMQFLFKVPNMAFFDSGGVRLMLTVPEKPEFDHPSSVIYFKVDNIQSAFEILTGRGVQFIGKAHLIAPMKDHDLWMAFFHDVDNNLLALMSEVPH